MTLYSIVFSASLLLLGVGVGLSVRASVLRTRMLLSIPTATEAELFAQIKRLKQINRARDVVTIAHVLGVGIGILLVLVSRGDA